MEIFKKFYLQLSAQSVQVANMSLISILAQDLLIFLTME